MKLFAIADLHLSIAVENKAMDRFGKRWEHHQTKLEKAWREKVSEEDWVILPGDLSWALRLEEAVEDLSFIHRLPGQKILMKGNHDFWWSTLSKLKTAQEENGWTSLHFLQNNAFPVGEDWVVAGTRGWIRESDPRFKEADKVILHRERVRLELALQAAQTYQQEGRQLVVVFHYPPFDKQLQGNDWTKLVRESGADCAFYGHIHQSESPYCFLDRWIDGVPYSLVAADYLQFVPLEVKKRVGFKPSTDSV